MNNPDLYTKTNELVHLDIKEILSEYIPLVQFKQDGGDKILDIGCGPGDVTLEILVPKLPESIKELVATDINPTMIKFAQNHYKHPKVKYDLLDITTQKLPKAFYENFDHVFSFYTLHWLQDQRHVMTNIFNLLQPGGDTLLIYLAYTPVGEVFQRLAKKDILQSYMRNVMDWVAAHQYVQDVEGTMHELLREVGFERITCHRRQRVYAHEDFDTYKVAMQAVNPFIRQMPDHLKERYLAEFYNELKTQAISEGYMNSESDEVRFPYSLVIINATKPKQIYI